MGYSESMHILYSIHDLYKNSTSSPLTQPDFFRHEFEKFTLLGIFCDKENIVISFDNFVKLNDIWVSEYSHNFHFPVDTLLVILILDSFFVDNFDGNFFLGGKMNGFFDFAESTFSQSFPNLIIIEVVFLLGQFLLFVISYFFPLLCHIFIIIINSFYLSRIYIRFLNFQYHISNFLHANRWQIVRFLRILWQYFKHFLLKSVQRLLPTIVI